MPWSNPSPPCNFGTRRVTPSGETSAYLAENHVARWEEWFLGEDPERCSEQEEDALLVGAFGEETGRLLGEMAQERGECPGRGGGTSPR